MGSTLGVPIFASPPFDRERAERDGEESALRHELPNRNQKTKTKLCGIIMIIITIRIIIIIITIRIIIIVIVIIKQPQECPSGQTFKSKSF